MCIFQLRIRMATPTYGGRTTAMYVCVCMCMYVCVYITKHKFKWHFMQHALACMVDGLEGIVGKG